MKNKKETMFNILMFLPMVVVIISLFYLPESIPAHYGDGFVVDRWGSKYEVLIYGIIPIVFGGIMRVIAQSDTKESNKNVRIYGGIIGLGVFNVIIFGFVYNAFRLTSLSDKLIAINLSQIILVTLGIALILMGNIIPKTKMNKLTGIRYPDGIQDEKTWNIRQRVGGISMMIVGAIIIIVNLVFKASSSVILITLLLLIIVIPTSILANKIIVK
ncbi:MAG: SdpI family protein [Lachnospiraceae bacterium]